MWKELTTSKYCSSLLSQWRLHQHYRTVPVNSLLDFSPPLVTKIKTNQMRPHSKLRICLERKTCLCPQMWFFNSSFKFKTRLKKNKQETGSAGLSHRWAEVDDFKLFGFSKLLRHDEQRNLTQSTQMLIQPLSSCSGNAVSVSNSDC